MLQLKLWHSHLSLAGLPILGYHPPSRPTVEASLDHELLGCKHLCTIAYHPIGNGIIERFHRQLKAALRVHTSTANWTEILPLILLCIRSALNTDLQCSATELVYGTILRLPGEFFHQIFPADMDDPTHHYSLNSSQLGENSKLLLFGTRSA